MEYIDGPDLGKMRDKRTDMFKADGNTAPIKFIYNVINALAFAHDRGVVHNDIKPGNVLLHPERGAVVCDWGLATTSINHGLVAVPKGTAHDASYPRAWHCGTSWYMCPEAGEYTFPEPSRDMYALGVMSLYVVGLVELPETITKYYYSIFGAVMEREEDLATRERWINFVDMRARRLDPMDTLQSAIRSMLLTEPTKRPSASKLRLDLVDHLTTTNTIAG
jgi:serine/threonine protein kinase